MTCDICGTETTSRVSTPEHPYAYIECGLPGMKLIGIAAQRCPSCDIEVPVLPRLGSLHTLIATSLIHKAGALSGAEVRFLRKFARLSAKDFAEIANTDPSTVSRWENEGQQQNAQADKLVRVIASTVIDQREPGRVALLKRHDYKEPTWVWVFENRRWKDTPKRATGT